MMAKLILKNLVVSFLIFLCILIIFITPAFADTLKLKNGRVINGELKEITDEKVVLEVKIGNSQGAVWFRKQDIESINNLSIEEVEVKLSTKKAVISEDKKNIITTPETEVLNKKEQFYDFKLGPYDIGENSITFKFPDPSIDTLYLFNLKGWKGLAGGKNKLVVSLYDKDRQLLTSKESLCTKKNGDAFGSLAFSEISREAVKNVTYFSILVEDCSQNAPDKPFG